MGFLFSLNNGTVNRTVNCWCSILKSKVKMSNVKCQDVVFTLDKTDGSVLEIHKVSNFHAGYANS